MRKIATTLLALACAGSITSACERKRDADDAEPAQTLEQGLKQAGKAIEHGAEKAGDALQRGVENARPSVERGVEKVGDMIERGAAKAGPAIEREAKRIGEAVERGVETTAGALAEPSDKPGATANFDTTAPNVRLMGDAKFYERDGKVRVKVRISDAPAGPHGIHVHERGDCSDLKRKSMGAHFDPDHHQHGLPRSAKRHLGDLGNIEVDKEGRGELDISVDKATLGGDARSFAGKAIIIHKDKDTGAGASGNSGDVIACAVIKAD